MTSTSGPKRRKGASKKNKKSWRKNTDIEDVTEFLDEQRFEKELGLDEKNDEELFVIDKGDEEQNTVLRTRAARKKAAKEKPLRCHQHLTPKVESIAHKTPGQRKNPILVQKEKKLSEQGIVKAKQKLAKSHRSQAEKIRKSQTLEKSTRRRTKFDFDLWEDNNEKLVDTVKTNEWLDGATKTHTLKGFQKKKAKVPKDLVVRPSNLNAVETPLAGESYNPTFKDHQELLWRATVTELQKEKMERKLDYHTTNMFPKKPPTHEEQVKEMAEGLFEDDSEEEDIEKVDKEGEDKEEDKTIGNKTKTERQKRKERARKFREVKALNRKKDKLKEQDFLRLKNIKKQLKSEEASVAENKVKRKEKKAARLLQPVTLSNYKFEEQDLDLKLSDELSGNLRNLKPEGSILADRFKSLQKRNVIEARVKQKIKRNSKNRKVVEKRSHKMGFAWEKK